MMKTTLFSIILLSVTSFRLTAQSKKDSLYVFIGQKIEVKNFPYEETAQRVDTVIVNGKTAYRKREIIYLDHRFVAKYKILNRVFGSFKADTIEFTVYDHYGIPAFSNYENVLLYVSYVNGKFVHEKYQFTDVYKTNNGRWAGAYQAHDYDQNDNKTVKPTPIEFISEVSYSVRNFQNEEVPKRFPTPYYQIRDDRAIAVWGNYVEELFELKKRGVLQKRGIFE